MTGQIFISNPSETVREVQETNANTLSPLEALILSSKQPEYVPTKHGIIKKMVSDNKADLSRITVLPGQRSGQPCIRNLRVTVWDVLDMLASGMTELEILDDYPYLEQADFAAIYAYASQKGREQISR